MARQARIQHEDGWYHVLNRGIDRQDIYEDERDRNHFLELLETASEMHALEVHGYVLMGNHYHLIVRTPEGNLSQAMQWVSVSYVVWYNRRHGRVGPLFQGRFKSVPVENGGWLYRLSQYVHLNPVRVRWLGLDKRGGRQEGSELSEASDAEEVRARLRVLRGHRWSSYRAYAGYESVPKWLHVDEILGRAGGKILERSRNYREELEGYVRSGCDEEWTERLRNSVAVGAEEFVIRMKQGLKTLNREWTDKKEMRRRRKFSEVVRVLEQVKGESWKEILVRHGDWGRDMALLVARSCTGLTLRELGEAAGGMDYGAVSMAVRRMEERIKKDKETRTAFNRIRQMLNV